MSDHYSYIMERDIPAVRAWALELARDDRDLWSFCHSIMMDIVEAQGAVHQSYVEHGHCDGFYDMRKGEFDVSSAATRLQIALEVRESFLQDRAENDKSG